MAPLLDTRQGADEKIEAFRAGIKDDIFLEPLYAGRVGLRESVRYVLAGVLLLLLIVLRPVFAQNTAASA